MESEAENLQRLERHAPVNDLHAGAANSFSDDNNRVGQLA
jgi:hypothetical protein